MHASTILVTRFGVLALVVLIASACTMPSPEGAPTSATATVEAATTELATPEAAPSKAAPAEAARTEQAPVEPAPVEPAPTENPPSTEATPQTAAPASGITPLPELTLAPTDTIVLEETITVIDESNPLVVAAAKDLARRLGIGLEAITLVSYEEVVWPDGAMGCPQPGMAYPQVQVDGARIRLDAGGVVYAYHSGGSRPPFLCEKR